MRLLKLAVWLILTTSANAHADKTDNQSSTEYERQVSTFWLQARKTDQQLIESGKQLVLTRQLLEQQQKQLDRQAALLDRWERILERHEALLDAWENCQEKKPSKAN